MGLWSWFLLPGTRLDWREEMRRSECAREHARRMAEWRAAGCPDELPMVLPDGWRPERHGTPKQRRNREQRLRQWWRRECERFNAGKRRWPPLGPGERWVSSQEAKRPLTPEEAAPSPKNVPR